MHGITLKGIKQQILEVPGLTDWDEIALLLDRAEARGNLDWELPIFACEAVGGDPHSATKAAAAILSTQISILIVDDILDEDPRGVHQQYGPGRTANFALALDSASQHLISSAPVPSEARSAASASLSRMAVGTARGQDLDVLHEGGEEGYWTLVKAKSTPFYGCALEIGAIIGGTDSETSEKLYELGVLVGEIVQLHDDLFDAFETPAKPDWQRRSNNLLILFATTADYESRPRFTELLENIDEPEALEEAQKILIESGAVSYCALHVVRRHKRCVNLLAQIPLPNPDQMLQLVDQQIQPLKALLEKVGATLPAEPIEGI